MVVIIFSVHTPKIYSQWIQQYTGTTANIHDIEFLNINTGWAVGGTCLKTTNGGTNWIQQNQPVGNKPLYGVHIYQEATYSNYLTQVYRFYYKIMFL